MTAWEALRDELLRRDLLHRDARAVARARRRLRRRSRGVRRWLALAGIAMALGVLAGGAAVVGGGALAVIALVRAGGFARQGTPAPAGPPPRPSRWSAAAPGLRRARSAAAARRGRVSALPEPLTAQGAEVLAAGDAALSTAVRLADRVGACERAVAAVREPGARAELRATAAGFLAELSRESHDLDELVAATGALLAASSPDGSAALVRLRRVEAVEALRGLARGYAEVRPAGP